MDFAELARILEELLAVYSGAPGSTFDRFLELAPQAVAMLQELGWELPGQFPCDWPYSGIGIGVGTGIQVSYSTKLNLPVASLFGLPQVGGRTAVAKCTAWQQHMSELLHRARLRARQARDTGPGFTETVTVERCPERHGEPAACGSWREQLDGLLEEGRREEAEIDAARRPYVQQQAWLRAARAAWDAYRGFRGSTGGSDEEDRRAEAQLLIRFASYLSDPRFRSQLEEIVGDKGSSPARRAAAGVYLLALDGDIDGLVRTFGALADSLFALGLETGAWLQDGLPRELLGIGREPEPPPGWEGSPLTQPVDTPDDFLRWLQGTEERESLFTSTSRDANAAANMSLLRDAYRLAEQVGLTDLPAQPLHDLTNGQLLSALANLRLAARRAVLTAPLAPPGDDGSRRAEETEVEELAGDLADDGSAPDNAPAIVPLTPRARSVLLALLKAEATDSESSLSQKEIAQRVNTTANSLKQVFRQLRDNELTHADRGCDGGTYLTHEGVLVARKLRDQAP